MLPLLDLQLTVVILQLYDIHITDDVKEKIIDALVKMNQIEEWKKKLEAFNVWGFKNIEPSLYDMDKAITQVVRKLSLRPVYY